MRKDGGRIMMTGNDFFDSPDRWLLFGCAVIVVVMVLWSAAMLS